MAVEARDIRPALEGGVPVRQRPLPYGRQVLGEAEKRAVLDVLRSERLTQGPVCGRFERRLAETCGARYAVAFNSGTTALQAALAALGIGPGNEVVVPAVTFVATANAVLYQGATPVVADVEPDTLCLDPDSLVRAIGPATRAVIPVHYAGHPADMQRIVEIARERDLAVIEDAAHALGAEWFDGRRLVAVGSNPDTLCCFSFHPVKTITTAEGGAVTTSSALLDARLRAFRHHGISQGPDRPADGDRISMLGINGRMSELHAAVGEIQLERMRRFLARRRELARTYGHLLGHLKELDLPVQRDGVSSAWHLYPVRLRLDRIRCDRSTILKALRAEGIGAQVHYVPLVLHPHLARRARVVDGGCPVAEREWQRLVSLPLWPGMTTCDQKDVVVALEKILSYYGR